MMNASEHKQECLKYGFIDTVLNDSNINAIFSAGLDENDAYDIECDLQCESFENFEEAFEYYKQRASEE